MHTQIMSEQSFTEYEIKLLVLSYKSHIYLLSNMLHLVPSSAVLCLRTKRKKTFHLETINLKFKTQ